jgi:GNAT superfamily N-acetyltransferase
VTEHFDSGEPQLDAWLRTSAGQGQRRDASRTFVVLDGDDVIAYYTLVAAQVEHANAPPRVRRGLSKRFPIPVCLLARLAVDRRRQGRGLGAAVLADALERAVRAAEQVGIRAVLVHALHRDAAAFYRRFGFELVTEDELTLMVTVGQIRRAHEEESRTPASATTVGNQGDAGLQPEDPWWETRDAWAATFALLGAYGCRPKLTVEGLVAFRRDGFVVRIEASDGQLPVVRHDSSLRLILEDAACAQLATSTVTFDGDRDLIQKVLGLFPDPEGPAQDGFIRHFPPRNDLDRMELAAAYATYRPELDALAACGVHAYVEANEWDMRIYSDISSNLLLDISIEDEGVSLAGPDDGDWVVFLTGPGGHEAEFTVPRQGDRELDSGALADAVTEALRRILRGGHVFLEHYDVRRGRLDESWSAPAPEDDDADGS